MLDNTFPPQKRFTGIWKNLVHLCRNYPGIKLFLDTKLFLGKKKVGLYLEFLRGREGSGRTPPGEEFRTTNAFISTSSSFNPIGGGLTAVPAPRTSWRLVSPSDYQECF